MKNQTEFRSLFDHIKKKIPDSKEISYSQLSEMLQEPNFEKSFSEFDTFMVVLLCRTAPYSQKFEDWMN